MNNASFKSIGVAVAVTALGIVFPISANASEMTNSFDETLSISTISQSLGTVTTSGSVSYVDESTVLWKLADDVVFDETNATVTQDGITEQLPSSATDVNGQPVDIEYKQTDRGVLIRTVSLIQSRGVGQCLLGIGGGVIGGGSAGGLGGAAVGTVTLPVVGTVSAGILGLVGGAVGGGMTGAASACF
ncbi:MAG: hypothetical protein PUG30_01090 [Actinomycetaceae bacterium]|nr:hypothetical protein [Actinomycetaceae bacterium]